MKPKKTKPTFKAKKRVTVISLIFIIVLAALTARLVWWQMIEGSSLRAEAVEQQTRDRILTSKRGIIYDRNLKALAISSSVDTITASPSEIQKAKSVDTVSAKLAEILEIDQEKIKEQLNRKNSYEVIARKIDKEKSNAIRAEKLVGITIVEDSKRYYPFANLASHVIGFTGVDNQGLAGIEMVYDNQLKGLPGRVISAKNAVGTDMPYQYEKNIAPENGTNIVLTIDETIQQFVEKHLKTALIENKLDKGASSIVMDAKTGEILAMATEPDFDINNPFGLSEDFKNQIINLPKEEKMEVQNKELQRIWRNKAVSDTYEPGSTFKIITTAIALEENVVNLNDRFYCKGSRQVANRVISCWKSGGHGSQSFVEGVQNSCNPVFMEVGARIGTQKFYEYLKLFGFMEKTGFDLPGEATGVFHDYSNFNEVELATYSFGQGFNITPLQLVTAVSAVTNNGMMIQPHIVKSLVDDDGNVLESYEKKEIRQVISPETAKTLCGILESVVTDGSGGNAYVPGYRVAGKTGTSEKTPRGSGKKIASFVGFAPADDPKVICLVMLDEPTGDQYYGGVIAAPVVGKIMEDTLKYLNVEPKYSAGEVTEYAVPEVRNLSLEEAKSKVKSAGITYLVLGNGNTVVNQMPRQGTTVNAGGVVILYTEETGETNAIVPNIIGQTPYAANKSLTDSRLNIKIIGSNASGSVAVKQDPPAGTTLSEGSLVRVEFRSLDVGVE